MFGDGIARSRRISVSILFVFLNFCLFVYINVRMQWKNIFFTLRWHSGNEWFSPQLIVNRYMMVHGMLDMCFGPKRQIWSIGFYEPIKCEHIERWFCFVSNYLSKQSNFLFLDSLDIYLVIRSSFVAIAADGTFLLLVSIAEKNVLHRRLIGMIQST